MDEQDSNQAITLRRIDRFYSYSLLEGESCDRSTMTSYTAYTIANDRERSGPRVDWFDVACRFG